MRIGYPKLVKDVFGLVLLFLLLGQALQVAAASPEAPVKGMVTMVDLGATECVPCKMMAPILVKLAKEYAGRAAIVFIDVWKDPKPAQRFGIKGIPTQIFFDKDGKEVYRHLGFFSEEGIIRQLKAMGVE